MSRISAWCLNFVYAAALLVCAPWILWAAVRHGKYRQGYAAKLLGRVQRRSGTRSCVWIHAVSVGEVNLLATTIAEFRQRLPDWEIVISTTTRTGYELATRKYADHCVFYCPLDFSWAVRQAMCRVRPRLLVLAELELWPNLIAAAGAAGARVVIINGRLSDGSFRGYRRIRPLVAWLLRQIDCIAAQNEETAERFRILGARPESVHVTGSLKFDGAESDRTNPQTCRLRELAAIEPGEVVLLAGSTQAPEEQIVLKIFQRLVSEYPQLRLILVPRHPERFDEVASLLDESGIAWSRRSELKSDPMNSRDATRHTVLLVDTIGELSAWWGTAQIAFVGGSFGDRGGQNMLEPAAYGAAVSFGPNTSNFRDIAGALLAAEGAVVVEAATALEAFVRRCLDDPQFAARLGQNGRRLVASQLGATEKTVDLLMGLTRGSLRRGKPLAA